MGEGSIKKMSKYIIEGGKKLEGEVTINSAKNSALKIMAASLMIDGKVKIKDIPRIKDVFTMIEVLKCLGSKITWNNNLLEIDSRNISHFEAPYDLISQMRASILVLGPLIARFGKAMVAMPGGCNIGARSIDLHIDGLTTLGTKIKVKHGYIEAICKKLKGTTFPLNYPSVGATENILMASTLARGKTVIENAAREPEIVDLANFLKKCGAQIDGAGTSTIEIEGVDKLHETNYQTIPDRIEAGTFLIAGALTGGQILLKNSRADHLHIVIEKLKDMGVKIVTKNNNILIKPTSRSTLKPVDVSTLPYPGFPTDLQAPISVLLSITRGTSIVTENIFENRFIYASDLNRMGTKIRINGHYSIIKGVDKLTSAPVKARDLRGGAALVLAGLIAEGKTEIEDIYHIERGYENFHFKLKKLGANIEKV